VAHVLEQRPELRPLLARTLSAGTGGVANLDGPEPGGVLAALSRTGSIRLDWAQAAANLVRDELKSEFSPSGILRATTVVMEPPAPAPKKQPAVKRKKTKRAAAVKKPAVKKPVKAAPRKKKAVKAAAKPARKAAGKRSTPRTPARKKKPAATRRR
jgi:hypothetical protein